MPQTHPDNASQDPLVTAATFADLAPPDCRSELIAGRIVTYPYHPIQLGVAAMRLALALGQFVHEHELGQPYAGGTGFWVARDPDSVRAPIWAFVSRDALPETIPDGWVEQPPVLVLEVCPDDAQSSDVLLKVGQWLDFDSTAVWVLRIDQRCLVEYRRDVTARHWQNRDTVTCEDLLPGFSYPLRRAFQGLAPA